MSQSNKKNIKTMHKVRFVVQDEEKKGQAVMRVVGNLPQLGNWNPFNGLLLEEYFDREWESIQQLVLPVGHEFQFKLVKIFQTGDVEWERLPNNCNRKFKPKFNTKLILKWSNHIGKAHNEGKSSMKLNGLPGVMITDQKQGKLPKNQKNKKTRLSDSDTNSDNENDSFCLGRKRSTDIREIMNHGDIQEIYYDTTELEHAYMNYGQKQVFIISGHSVLSNQFQQKIDRELRELYEVDNLKFKWLYLGEQDPNILKMKKKVSFKKLQQKNKKILLDEHINKNAHKNYFIFVDLDSALNTNVGHSCACLYLPDYEFDRAIQYLEELEQFQLVCFQSREANMKLLAIFEEKRIQSQQKEVMIKEGSPSRVRKPDNLGDITLQKILEELELWQTEKTINTAHIFTKNEAITNILTPNSILLIDSEIMKVDKKFFECLLQKNCEKRLIIIMHKVGVPEWIHNFSQAKNVCIILDNFMKLYLLGKLYDPTKKHRTAIEYIKMRATLFQKQFGGSWEINDNSFTYKFQGGSASKATNIKCQIQNVLLKDYNYFKMSMKQNKMKINWSLSHPVRLLRTLVRIKSIEEGQIGNMYIVSYNEQSSELKKMLRLLINTHYLLMVHGKNTPVYDFGYGSLHTSKYSIRDSESEFKRQSCSSTDHETEASITDNKNRKLEFLQKKMLFQEQEKRKVTTNQQETKKVENQ